MTRPTGLLTGMDMIGIVVPAHNEEDLIGKCLHSLAAASRCAHLRDEDVMIVVALDSCNDRTQAIARDMGAITVSVNARNVGITRAHGARVALEAGARWLAFTDSDSTVAPDWLSIQLGLRSDAVCGTVAVDAWESYSDLMRQHFAMTYTDADGHRHIHGANLGVSAAAYVRAGGFPPLACSEDVALVDALTKTGASIAWSAKPRVVTSARKTYRAPDGFGATLERVERAQMEYGVRHA